MTPLLKVQNLVTRFYTNDGVVHAVNGVSFTLHEGELKMSPVQLRRIRGKEIGFIFQDPLSSLNPLLTIRRQITESLVERLDLSERAAPSGE
jgi:ABC-type dipeptide/oligopeptide/nickel transport system ATPase component